MSLLGVNDPAHPVAPLDDSKSNTGAPDWYAQAEKAINDVRAENQVLRQQLQQVQSSAGDSSGGSAPKPNKPEIFTAKKKQRVDLWVFNMTQYFAATAVAEHRKVPFAASFLQGAALTWWQAHITLAATPNSGVTLITTWLEFSERIIAQFKPINSEKVARDALYSLKQTKSVIGYIFQFNLLCLDIPQITDSEKLDKFIRGLKPNIQSKLLIEDPNTTTQAMEIAQRIDSVYYRTYLMNKRGGDDGGVRAMDIDNIEHTHNKSTSSINAIEKKSKKLSPEEQKRCKDNKLCFNCKETGHISRKCPKKLNKSNNNKSGKAKAQ